MFHFVVVTSKKTLQPGRLLLSLLLFKLDSLVFIFIQNLLPFLMDNKVQIGQPICVILISAIHTLVSGISPKMVREHGLLYSQPQSNLGLVIVSLNGLRMNGMPGVQQSSNLVLRLGSILSSGIVIL